MKNKLLTFLGISILTLFIGTTRVSASTSSSFFPSSLFYSTYEYYATLDSSVITNLIDYWQTNWSDEFPYYIIFSSNSNTISITPLMTNNEITARTSVTGHPRFYTDARGDWDYTFLYNYGLSGDNAGTYYLSDREYGFGTQQLIYSSNTTLTFKSPNSLLENVSATIQAWSDLTLDVAYPLMDIEGGDEIPTYLTLTNGSTPADFTQVDMSQYDYIILSLRNYNISPYNTTIYSLGRLCFTPVYNYGMTQKQEYFNGYQTQACSENYNTSTPVSIYIIQSDIDNHAVYYIKRYGNETNVLQIPTSIFDITYVTSENADDPQVSINGRSYPAIPYSQLTDTAIISTDDGYISGQVCSPGDINCLSNVSGISIDDLFSNPLHLLESVWDSITSVLNVIGEFIGILPPVLQAFLYTSFILGLVIGILKLILG